MTKKWKTKEEKYDEIFHACGSAVGTWDDLELFCYAHEQLFKYYLNSASPKELELFMEGEDVNV